MEFFVFWKLSIECSKSISDELMLTFLTNGCHCWAPAWHDVSTSTSVFCCSCRLESLHVGLLLSGICCAIQPIAKCRSISSTVHMLIKSLPLKKQRCRHEGPNVSLKYRSLQSAVHMLATRLSLKRSEVPPSGEESVAKKPDHFNGVHMLAKCLSPKRAELPPWGAESVAKTAWLSFWSPPPHILRCH